MRYLRAVNASVEFDASNDFDDSTVEFCNEKRDLEARSKWKTIWQPIHFLGYQMIICEFGGMLIWRIARMFIAFEIIISLSSLILQSCYRSIGCFLFHVQTGKYSRLSISRILCEIRLEMNAPTASEWKGPVPYRFHMQSAVTCNLNKLCELLLWPSSRWLMNYYDMIMMHVCVVSEFIETIQTIPRYSTYIWRRKF